MSYVLIALAYVLTTFLATLWFAWPTVETYGNAPWPWHPDAYRRFPIPVRFIFTWEVVVLLPPIILLIVSVWTFKDVLNDLVGCLEKFRG